MSLAQSLKYQSPSKMSGTSPSKVSTKMSGTGMNASARSKGFQSSTDFSKHLKNLQQQQTDENVEDEYIKNLQQQIAYQELELKLLKEKELEQKQSVSQIDKFFNDGVPLNENILALKNQYNHIKKQLENRIDEINELRMDEKKVATDLQKKYTNNSTQLKTIIESLEKKEKDFSVHMNEARMAFLNERHRRLQADKELKKIQSMLKEKNDENLKMARDLERESILVHHREEMLKNKRMKTKEEIKAKDDWLNSLTKEVEKKRGEVAFNPAISMLENENIDLQARILRCDKETNMSIARVKEMEMFLETRSREREIEADMKRDLVAKINQVKFRIDEQNKMNEVEIKKRVELKEEIDKKDLEKEISDVKNEKTVVRQRQQEKEDHIKNMAQDKMGAQQDIMSLEQENVGFEKDLKENREFLMKLKNSYEALTLEEKELIAKLDPVVADINKIKTIIPAIEANNEKLKEQIAHMEKVSELSLQIKNVNLEELKLLNQSNDQVQNTISDLVRKWDFLQRMGATNSH